MITTEPRPSTTKDAETTGPIMVELNGSYESAEALRWAAAMCTRLGRRLEVTSTWSPGIGEFRPDAHEAVRRRMSADLRSWSGLAGDEHMVPTQRIVEGVWPTALVHAAAAQRAEMLVVPLATGPSPTAATSEDAAKSLLQRTTSSMVAVVPVSGASRPVRRIVVGTPDGMSPQRLVDEAKQLARAWGAELHIVGVLPLAIEFLPSSDPSSVWQVEQRLRARRWNALLDDSSMRAHLHIVEGNDPVDGWVRVARQVHADLIVAPPEWRSSSGRSRRASSLVHLARHIGLAVVSVPPAVEASDA